MTELERWAIERNRAHRDALALGAWMHTQALLAELRRQYELARVYRAEAQRALEHVL